MKMKGNENKTGEGLKETFRRAVRTFFQAAIGYFAANAALVNFDDGTAFKRVLIGLVASAAACGIAAVMNLPEKSRPSPDSVAEIETD
ncbi:MAG: hypothetical protein IJS45_06015 [Clostridia bacterium]|nr:hypothetical protein [Clostridia bacterium]